jgi:hypothetical protein
MKIRVSLMSGRGGSTGAMTSALLTSRSDCALAFAIVIVIPKRMKAERKDLIFTIGIATSPPGISGLFQSSKLRTPP